MPENCARGRGGIRLIAPPIVADRRHREDHPFPDAFGHHGHRREFVVLQNQGNDQEPGREDGDPAGILTAAFGQFRGRHGE